MITILYPKDDYEAANIALKAQALSQSDTTKIYIVPKHFGRNEDSIKQNLSKTKVALYIAFEREVDYITLDELTYLDQRHVPIYCIIPDNIENPLPESETSEAFTFSLTDKFKAVERIQNLIGLLTTSNKYPSHKKMSEIDMAVILCMLTVLIIVLTYPDLRSKKLSEL